MDYRAGSQDEGRCLLSVLRQSMRLSASTVQHAKWHQGIHVNGKEAHTNAIIHAQDLICVSLPAPKQAYVPKPYFLPLRLAYEDEWLMVVDKPAPLACQSGRNHPDDSLENAMFAMLGCPESFVYRPVNRLDKGTSGLMVVAKDAHVQQLLQSTLHSDAFIRRYQAITCGVPPKSEDTICSAIGKADGASIRREVRSDGKQAVTYYHVETVCGDRALVGLRLGTGRTHQIRVHLASIGCPIFGDFLYGTESGLLPGRFALHASELLLKHPITGQDLCCVSPLPDELRQLLC